MKKDYIFKSKRLGFRNWTQNDLEQFSEMNANPNVMEHFPKPLTENETSAFIERLLKHYETYGYCYFATEILNTGEFIGFIGLAYQDYKTDFTPATDIGWRLKQSAWGYGYATEGALRCLDFAFNHLHLEQVIATCTHKNNKSEHVMKKVGMKMIGKFNHPKLKDYPEYETCLCYQITKEDYQFKSQ
ncbi:GNAT family N-acetyltransferase [Xanthomarina sp. F2636L]|uniref:GNAT family N-acetyltransferase n=1 Tax=Xanthomarina sp. F2636L TaxID=2996018 RepID=UPI00225DD772|nr:GNAT family N-acetyltransferase [Xanthomarina sp. F2636L]MCX7550389.1 GNAT family N-acetyltransferase [Xanthomarina sp. F2636L]